MKRIAPPTIYPSVRRRVEAPYLSLKAYAYYMVWCGMVWYDIRERPRGTADSRGMSKSRHAEATFR